MKINRFGKKVELIYHTNEFARAAFNFQYFRLITGMFSGYANEINSCGADGTI